MNDRHKPGGALRFLRRELKNAVFMALGVLSAGMGLKGFLLSSHFIDGGVTGLSVLLLSTTGVPLAVWLPLGNVLFIAGGWPTIGPAFAVRSTLTIACFAVVLATVHYLVVFHDPPPT